MTQFEDKFMEVQASMISLAMEYVQNQAEKIYIYCIAEEALQSYKVFYKINGIVIEMDKVNEVATNKIDDSDNMAFALLEYGTEDIQKLIDVCQEYNREHPTEMWLIYDAKKNSLDSRYSYEGRYDKDEELLPRLEFEKWFEEVKKQATVGEKDMPQQDQSIIYPLPTDALLQEREVAWKIRLPDDYKNFIMRKNGFRPSKNLFSLQNRSFLIERFLCVLENTKDNPLGVYDIDVVMSQLDERLFVHENILGFELVPIAALFGGDFLCLNYIEDPENPSICIWYHEESYELEPAIEFVANDFTEFLAMLQD